MKNGLLVCHPRSKVKNIGDYIQSLAQEQFYSHIDYYVEREKLSLFHSEEKTKVIMNAWFMWEPEHFPPSDDIEPLFISFHIVPKISERLLTKKTLSYLKKYEPIGTRDFGTKKLLERYGITAYFTGCLTLTLGLKYKSQIRNNSIYFVDPFYEMCGMKRNLFNIVSYVKSFIYYIKYARITNKIIPHFDNEYKTIFRYISNKLEARLCATTFYAYYHKIFSDELLHNAKFIKHDIAVKDGFDNEYFMQLAKQLMHEYSKAKLVITSRIHCGLPCLGVETPTIFVTADLLEGDEIRSGGRLAGLVELFHVIKWTSNGFISLSSSINELLHKGKIGLDSELYNKSDYVGLRDKMIKIVKSFLSNGNN